MKQLTIYMPDANFQQVIDMLAGLDFVSIGTPKNGFFITDELIAESNEEYRKMLEIPGMG